MSSFNHLQELCLNLWIVLHITWSLSDFITHACVHTVLLSTASASCACERHTHTHITLYSPSAGGVTLRGSDGQLHPRAPPKPLRVSAVFPNAIPLPPKNQDDDPSSFYDELVVQVEKEFKITHPKAFVFSPPHLLLSCLWKCGTLNLLSVWPLPVVSRCHSLGGRAMWIDCVQRRSGRAGLALQRHPLAFWRHSSVKQHHSCRCYHGKKQQGKWKTGILKSPKFV